MIGFLIMMIVSFIVMILGFLIWKRGKINLIMHYHQENVKDCEGYGRGMGKTFIALGIVILLTGIIWLFDNLSEWISIGFPMTGFVVCIVQMIRIQRKYNEGVF